MVAFYGHDILRRGWGPRVELASLVLSAQSSTIQVGSRGRRFIVSTFLDVSGYDVNVQVPERPHVKLALPGVVRPKFPRGAVSPMSFSPNNALLFSG
jgi:hypothetical protein